MRERFVVSGPPSLGSTPNGYIEVTGCVVVQAHYIGSDKDSNLWLLNAAEWSDMIAGRPDVWDGFVRSVGGEVRVSRHYAMDYAAFWDAMGAALPALGVRGLGYGLQEGPVWHDNGNRGFYTYVKELEAEA